MGTNGLSEIYLYRTPKSYKFKCNNISDLSLRLMISSVDAYDNDNFNEFTSILLESLVSTTQSPKIHYAFLKKLEKQGLVINSSFRAISTVSLQHSLSHYSRYYC